MLRVVRPLLACVLAAALLGWLLHGAQLPFERLTQLPPWLLPFSVAGLCVSYALRAARIHGELAAPAVGAPVGAATAAAAANATEAPPLRWRDVLRVSLLHNAAVNLLPMRSGELAYPYLLRRELGVALPTAVASLLWLRLQDLLVLLGLLLVLWPAPWPLRVLLLALYALLVGRALTWLRRQTPVPDGDVEEASATTQASSPAPAPTPAPMPVPWRTVWRRCRARLAQVARAVADPHRHRASGWLWCGANWCLKLTVVAVLLTQLSAGLHAQHGLRGALGGELSALLPLQGPAGLGTYELGVWAGASWGDVSWGVPGASSAPSTADLALAALLAHGVLFGTALGAGFVALLWQSTLRRKRDNRR